jgi:TPR repeat protein
MRRIHSKVSAAVSLALLCTMSCSAALAIEARTELPRIKADAERGVIKQEIQLGAAYFIGRGVPQNLELAAHWYERAARSGDPLAQNEIGYFYQVGIGVPRDLARAAEWYKRSAEGGCLEAKINLGVAYLWGIGVKKDPLFALQLISEAAARKSGMADAYLGDMYYFGIGVPADQKAATQWYEKGAHLNDPMAQYRLATLLSVPNAEKQDLPKAAKLFRESAEAGFVQSRFALGLLLTNHSELPAQPNETITLLQQASDAGIWKASAVLGVIYRDGRNIAPDRGKAYYYFRLAQLQAGEAAQTKMQNDLAILSRELTQGETSALDTQAGQWVQRHTGALQFVAKKGSIGRDFPTYAIAAADSDTHAGQIIPGPLPQLEP